MVLKEKQKLQEWEKGVKDSVDFWHDKIPCWEMCHCPEEIKSQCPAPKYPFLPCWETEGTYLKLNDDGDKGDDISICRVCRVYKRYGEGELIEIKLRGRGLDSYCRSIKERCKGYYKKSGENAPKACFGEI